MRQRVAGQRPAQRRPLAGREANGPEMAARAAVVEVQVGRAVAPDQDVVLGGIAARPALEPHQRGGRL